jgi:hypothetical protein
MKVVGVKTCVADNVESPAPRAAKVPFNMCVTSAQSNHEQDVIHTINASGFVECLEMKSLTCALALGAHPFDSGHVWSGRFKRCGVADMMLTAP